MRACEDDIVVYRMVYDMGVFSKFRQDMLMSLTFPAAVFSVVEIDWGE